MTRSMFPLLLLLSACGPDVTPWKGTWAGTVSINTGRQPVVTTGTLVISDGGRFAATTDPTGSPAVSYAAELVAATADASAVTFTGPSNVTLTASPSDGCTRTVTVDSGEGTRSGDSLTLSVRGKVNSACAGGSSVAESFLLDIAATRR